MYSRTFLQTEASECALASAAMVSTAHGLHINLADLRSLSPVSLKGATQQLVHYAGELNFRSRTAGFLKPCQTVYLRYAAYPYQKFGLHTSRINVQLDDQAIRTYGQAIVLKPGLTLEADVLQERRKVWEWALEPLLAARANAKVLNSDLKPAISPNNSTTVK